MSHSCKGSFLGFHVIFLAAILKYPTLSTGPNWDAETRQQAAGAGQPSASGGTYPACPACRARRKVALLPLSTPIPQLCPQSRPAPQWGRLAGSRCPALTAGRRRDTFPVRGARPHRGNLSRLGTQSVGVSGGNP